MKTTAAPSRPSTGADAGVEFMYFVGMMFWICGVPGIMVMVIEAAPKTKESNEQMPGDVRFLPEVPGDGQNREDDDEQADAAVGQRHGDEGERDQDAQRPVDTRRR